jgi:hypothetical protein
MLVQNVEDARRQFLILEAEYGHRPQYRGNRRSDMETEATTSLPAEPAEPAEPVEPVPVILVRRTTPVLILVATRRIDSAKAYIKDLVPTGNITCSDLPQLVGPSDN